MMNLLQRYLAFQRDTGVDEIILPEPWVDVQDDRRHDDGRGDRRDDRREESRSQTGIGKGGIAQSAPETGPRREPTSEARGQAGSMAAMREGEDASAYLRRVSESLGGKQGAVSGGNESPSSVNPTSAQSGSPGKSRPIHEKAVSAIPVLEFADKDAWKAAFLNEAKSLHPVGAGRKLGPWVFGQGVSRPLLAVVGLEPTLDANEESGPFAGAEGELLAKMLKAIKLDPALMYYASLMKARHPGRGWARRDTVKLVPWLQAEITLIEPQFVLVLGEDVHQILGRVGHAYADLRLRSWEFAGTEMAMTLSPKVLLAEENLKREAWKDLQWLMQRLKDLGAIA